MAANRSLLTLADLQSDMRAFTVARAHEKTYDLPQYATPINIFGAVQVPMYGTQIVILADTVRANFAAIFRGVVFGFQGSGTPPNPTDATFTIDVDRPPGTTNGYPERWFEAVPFPVGSFSAGLVWPVTFRHENGEEIRIKATANANMGTGSGNYFVAALVGWEWPKEND